MVAVKQTTLPEIYTSLCAVLRKSPQLTVHVTNHIATKHAIHSLPAVFSSDAVPEAEKLATFGELARALVAHLGGDKKALGKLQGQLAQGQAKEAPASEEKSEPIAGTPGWKPEDLTKDRKAVIPVRTADESTPTAEATPRVEPVLPEIADPAVWVRKPGTIDEAYNVAFGGDPGDGFFTHQTRFRPARVQATRHLTGSEFDAFCTDFFKDHAWLAGKGGTDDTHQFVVLVSAPDRPRLLVNPEGHNYARYVGLLVADREAWRKRLHPAPPVTPSPATPAPSTRQVVPWNDADLRKQFEALLEVAARIPGATITVQISMPTHV